MQSTNRRWQNHLLSKGIIPFFLDRLRSHAMNSKMQYENSPFYFPIQNESEDVLTSAFYEYAENFPVEIYIEPTNLCNLQCIMCARPKMTRPKGIMSMPLFQRIIDEVADNQPYAYVHFYGIGDPLMDPDIAAKLRYAYDKGLRNTLVFTNGQLLTAPLAEKLIDSGVSTIGVDLDGFSQETYSRIRVGGSFLKAKDAIETLYSKIRGDNRRTRVDIAYQIYPGINEHDIAPFIAWCVENDYEYKLVTMHTWAGLRDDIPASNVSGICDDHRSDRKNPCAMLWRLFVAWDGRVGLCFQDADCANILGDLKQESIADIWQGQHLARRREHVAGVFHGLCASCSSNTNIKTPDCNSILYPPNLRS